ncbi:DUF5348 domain-containing protein [Sutcliffiella cohnii]|uniref:DUF5348 domain-containing protein n=1 Tax=Sutcliffiella cohnii TaxID=33932 RepID=UPI002E24D296|nr:DUF5348 domain-containing protein [Sutcliffiella cohnii]
MMKKGILIYDHEVQEWRLWIEHKAYWLQQGDSFELLVQNQYFQAYLEKDFDWFVTLEGEVMFVLHVQHIYKVLVNPQNYLEVEDPF